MSGERQGDIIEELPHAAFRHDRAEQDEQENVAGRDANRGAVNALGVREEMVRQRGPVVAAVHEHAREFAPVQSVNDEDDGQDRQRVARDAARAFQHQHDEQRRHGEVRVVRVAGALDDAEIIGIDVDWRGEGKGRENPVEDGRLRHVRFFSRRVHQKAQREDHRDMQRAMHQRDRGTEGRRVKMIAGD